MGEAEVRERRAVAFCKKYCHVRQACLSWALTAGEVGVWGGTTADERRTIKRRTQRAASRAALQTTP
jgi:WhiB family redox-sensing transcriptional regulator